MMFLVWCRTCWSSVSSN